MPYQLLDVIRRAVARDLQEVFIRARIRDARDRADLRVAQLPALHRRADVRQLRERVPDAHLLARGAEPDAALPVEPVRAGLRETVRPSAATIELRDQHEQPMVRGIQVPGELGDLRGELLVRDAAGVAAELILGASKLVKRSVRFHCTNSIPDTVIIYSLA